MPPNGGVAQPLTALVGGQSIAVILIRLAVQPQFVDVLVGQASKVTLSPSSSLRQQHHPDGSA